MCEHLEKVHSPSVVELLLLLSDLAIDLLPHLAELQLSSQNLVLLSLKGSLGFLKSSLQLLLLALHAPPLFVELMDGTATVAELIKQVLDLVGKVLSNVLSLSSKRGKRNNTSSFLSQTR